MRNYVNYFIYVNLYVDPHYSFATGTIVHISSCGLHKYILSFETKSNGSSKHSYICILYI